MRLIALFLTAFFATTFAGGADWNNRFPVEDQSLSQCSIVVVARISPMAMIARKEFVSDGQGGIVEATCQFELTVERSIRGSLKPGPQNVLSAYNLQVTSSLNLSRPAIWFLARTYAAAIPSGPLYPYAQRALPLRDEIFLAAIYHDHLGDKFRDLLKSNSVNKIRAMYYVGGSLPFNFDIDRMGDDVILTIPAGSPAQKSWPEQEPKCRPGFEADLEACARDPDPRVRQIAILAIDRINEPKAIGALRASLADPDRSVRCTAAAVLLARHDQSSIQRIRKVLPEMRCAEAGAEKLLVHPIQPLMMAYEAFEDWHSPITVPLLIDQLANGTPLGRPVELQRVPYYASSLAELSCSILKDKTGLNFPHDPALALELWQKSQNAQSPADTLARELLPYKVDLTASYKLAGSDYRISLWNLSDVSVWISAMPAISNSRSPLSKESNSFRRLGPRASFTFRVPGGFTSLPPDLRLHFTHLPPDRHKLGWLGVLEVNQEQALP